MKRSVNDGSESPVVGRRTARPSGVTLQIMVPQRVKQAISARALKAGTTHRGVVLQALRDSGIAVADDVRLDCRKVRG